MLELELDKTKAPAVLARTAVLILALCFGLRLIDVFNIQSDEWFGEQVVTKVLGLAIVVAYAVWSGYGLARVGFRKSALKSVIWIGVGLAAVVMAATFFVQFLYLQSQAAAPVFSLGVQGSGLLASASVLAFNLVIAAMMGLAWGCFFFWFSSLWVGIFAYAFYIAAPGVFHITTAAGASSLAFFITLAVFVFVALLPVVHWLSKSWRK